MRIVAAYMLAVLGGNANPDEAAVTKILDSVGVKAKAEEMKKVISELNGKDLDELIAKGKEKLAAVPTGGGGGGGGGAAAAGGDDAGKAAEAAPEPEPEEEEEEADLGFSLFD